MCLCRDTRNMPESFLWGLNYFMLCRSPCGQGVHAVGHARSCAPPLLLLSLTHCCLL